jgi:FPC/CPF motif-containing protein YcgG
MTASLVSQVDLTAYSSSMPPDFFRLDLVKYQFSEVPWHITIRFSTSLVFSPPPLFILRPRTKASLIGKAALRAHVSLDISFRPLQSLDTLISDTPSAEFPDHNIVSWNIEADAQAKPFLAKVGTANNREQSFTIFKDDNHEVFDRDGFHFTVRYYAQV